MKRIRWGYGANAIEVRPRWDGTPERDGSCQQTGDWAALRVRDSGHAWCLIGRDPQSLLQIRSYLASEDYMSNPTRMCDHEVITRFANILAAGTLVVFARRTDKSGARDLAPISAPGLAEPTRTSDPSGERSPDHPAARGSANRGTKASKKVSPVLERIEVRVVGEDGRGLANVTVAIKNSQNQISESATDRNGHAEFRGLEPGTYLVSLPKCDKDAWRIARTEKLPANEKQDQAAAWTANRAYATQGLIHTAKQGECIAQLGAIYGFFPRTIWDDPKNASLRAARKDLYILSSGDRVTIPAKRLSDAECRSQTRLVIRRLGVPERLRVRFHDKANRPRMGEPYILSLRSKDSGQAQLAGRTDADGFVDVPIPPDADLATLVLGEGASQTVFQLQFGCLDPIDFVSGWQARLNNLGFSCGSVSGALDQRTKYAIRAFQRSQRFSETGAMDAQTQQALERAYLS